MVGHGSSGLWEQIVLKRGVETCEKLDVGAFARVCTLRYRLRPSWGLKREDYGWQE